MIQFNKIYKNKYWGDNKNTLSGSGSTLEANIYRNIFLSKFINNNKIKKVYDICGDCNWQNQFVKLVKDKNFEYFGFDVSAVALLRAKIKNYNIPNMSFSNKPIDLCNTILDCNDKLNSLVLIKEVIQHLPLNLGIKMLQNIKKSGIKYIAITNHDQELFNVNENYNVNIGDFYPNNMFLKPFNFKNPLADVKDIIKNKDLIKKYGNLIIFNIQEQNI